MPNKTAAEIIVVGSYNHDLALSVARFPAPGETCLAQGRVASPGGKGSNQAIQAALCGTDVAMIAAIGDDATGDAALQLWAEAGVDTRGIARIEGAATGMAVILVDAFGENCIVVDSGANSRLTASHIDAAADQIGAAKLVLAQLETPADATRRAFQIAQGAGAVTLLNAAPAPETLDAALLALTDILVVNEHEGALLSGRTAPTQIGEALLAKVGRAVVLTLGGLGAVVFAKDAPPLSRLAPAIEVVDTTGAGDAFIGAFAARLAATGELEGALDWGIAAGALACTAAGAASSYADAARIEGLRLD